MEFNKQYLTYEEYVNLGGTLSETPFNILELEAQKTIDRYTFGRLQNLETQNQEVKVCILKLMEFINTYNTYLNRDKSISSTSTDGYSETYIQPSDTVTKSKTAATKDIVQTYLAECKLEDGTPYLYCGVE